MKGIHEYNQQIEALAERSYPQVTLLKQVKGVGTLIALTFRLTLEDEADFTLVIATLRTRLGPRRNFRIADNLACSQWRSFAV